MSGPTGGHVVFAANLRRLCTSTTSIADICRDTGINRQQFNKYLAGRSIPSARVLRKICQRLGVNEIELLNGPHGKPGNDSAFANDDAPVLQTRLGKELNRLSKLLIAGQKAIAPVTATDFGAGSYYAYFPFSGMENHLIRTYIEAWWHNDTLAFTRFTKVNGGGGKPGFTLRARHYGLAIAAQNEISLVARNRRAPHQLSMINISTTVIMEKYFLGLTMTRGLGMPIACRAILEKIDPSLTRRERVNACGLVSRNDASVPPFVHAATNPDERRGPILQVPDSDQIVSSILFGQS